MRRLPPRSAGVVILGLLVTGTAAVTVPADKAPIETVPAPGLPAAAEAVLDDVRAVLSPVAPPGSGEHPAPDLPAAPVAPPDPSGHPMPAGSASSQPEPSGSPSVVAAPAAEPVSPGAAGQPVRCEGIATAVSAAPRTVAPGGQATLSVSMTNSNNRRLSRLSLAERITGTEGVRFSVVSTDPAADSISATGIFFDDLGPVPPGETRVVKIVLGIGAKSGLGRLLTDATATGDCEGGRAGGGTVDVEGRALLEEPTVSRSSPVPAAPRPARAALGGSAAAAAPAVAGAGGGGGGPLSRTGGLTGFGLACWLVAAGLALRGLGQRHLPEDRPVRWKSWRAHRASTTRQPG